MNIDKEKLKEACKTSLIVTSYIVLVIILVVCIAAAVAFSHPFIKVLLFIFLLFTIITCSCYIDKVYKPSRQSLGPR